MTSPAPEPHHPEGLEPRVEKLEAGQETMTSKLDNILGLLDTGRGPKDGEPSTTTADPAPPADMAEQMRQAVRDVHAERDQAAAKEPPKPEVPPREAGQPAKQRLARVLYGKDPQR